MIKVHLTTDELKNKNACPEGLQLFRSWFGEEKELELDYLTQIMIATSEAKHFYQWSCDVGLSPRFNLRSANLQGADLQGADLYGADLYGADLQGADLYGANLQGADLYGADLYGANLQGADLYGANLRSALHNDYTRWPEGFDLTDLT